MEEPNAFALSQLLDDERVYEMIRDLRWGEGIQCPHCESKETIRRGMHYNQKARRRYECKSCKKRFDDLTGTALAGHHQPVSVWVLCLYFMGLNLSQSQIAQELDMNISDTQEMCESLRKMVEKKSLIFSFQTKLNLMRSILQRVIRETLQK